MENSKLLIDRDYMLSKSLNEVLKHLHSLIISQKLDPKSSFEVETSIQLLNNILSKESEELKTTTLILKKAINQSFLDNPELDGVQLWILKNQNSEISNCSLIKMYLNGKS